MVHFRYAKNNKNSLFLFMTIVLRIKLFALNKNLSIQGFDFRQMLLFWLSKHFFWRGAFEMIEYSPLWYKIFLNCLK